jgi:DNA-directed RNA polymerase specialized sigma24 family protein
MIEDEIIAAERHAALRAAFAELPPHCRRLLAMCMGETSHSYAEISVTLQMPVGSIGPQRGRCLERLRQSSSLRAFTDDEIAGPSVGCPGGEARA